MNHPRIIQFLAVVVAAAFLAAAGMVLPRLAASSERYELTPPGDSVALTRPEVALLTTFSGGLRAPLVTYLWLRAENNKQEGRLDDALQLGDMICTLQPQFPGVWAFQYWNMAWNMSAATHTPEERWLWVTNGLRLLRDRGIPLNPRSLLLYKELGWLFFSKMGQNLDDMHWVYKQRWAADMQHLMGAPPMEGVDEVIDAFRPVASAPLDKAPRRQGRDLIQQDKLAELLADPNVAAYVRLLGQEGINIDRSLLNAYNRLSREENAEVVRLLPPVLEREQDKAVSALINSKDFAAARAKLIALVRAHILWNEYRMDPAWMLALMEKYHAPLDWRLPWPHGLYWVSKGLNTCNDIPVGKIDWANTDRISFGCLMGMMSFGRLAYIENPQKPDSPTVDYTSDWRYIDATNQEYLDQVPKAGQARGEKMEQNIFKTGHINFLIYAIQMLYANYQWDKAQYYLDWIKKNYNMQGGDWDLDLKDFVIAQFNSDPAPNIEIAKTQLTASLQMAYYFMAQGDRRKFNDSFGYARRVYDVYQKNSEFIRLKFTPFEAIASHIALQMVLEPRAAGYYLPLLGRIQLYSHLDDRARVLIYDRLYNSMVLQKQCQAEGLDFNKAFPQPPGLEQYRQWQQEQLQLNPANQNTMPGKKG